MRRVDDHGAAAVLDAPERVDLGSRAGAWPARPDDPRERGRSLYSSSGKISFISCLKPWSNSRLPQQASAKMKPPCSTKSRRFCLADGRELGRVVAVEEDDRGLEQVRDGGDRRDRRPARSAGSSSRARRRSTRLRTSSGSLFQSPVGAMAELVDQDRRAALGQEQQGEAGRQDRVVLDQRALARTRRACSARGPAPRRPGDTSRSGRRTGRRRAGRRAPGRRDSRTSTAGRAPKFWPTWKWLASQSIPRLEVAVDSALAAVLDRLALEEFLALEPARARR